MPRIEDIEQFNESLVRAGDEPEILAERGEDLEHVPRPDEGLPGDLGDLLSEEGEFPEQPPEEAEEEGEELLSRLSEALEEEEEAPAEAPEEGGGEDIFADLDLGGEEFEMPSDLGIEEEEGPPEEEAPEEEVPEEEAAEPGEEELPEEFGELEEGLEEGLEEAAELGGEFEEARELAEELEETPEAGEEEILEGPSEEEFDLGDFDFGEELEEGLEEAGELGEAPEAPPEAPPEEEPSEEAAEAEEGLLDEFTGAELGDLGELGEEEELDLEGDLADLIGESPEAEEPEAGGEDVGGPPEVEDELDLSAIESDFVDEEEPEEEFELPEESLEEIAAGAEAEPEAGFEAEPIPDEELPSFEGVEEFEDFGEMEGLGDLEADEEEFDVDEFNLDEFGTEFGVVEEAVEGLEGAEEGAPEAGGEEEEVEAAAEGPELSLSDEEFDHLRKALGILPLNLKREVEEIIAEGKASPEQTEELVHALVAGQAPSQIADIASRILGRRVQIPKGYQKRSGLAFEAEQRTFAYQFKHKILPVLRVVTLAAVVLAIVGYLSYQFIYQPIYANTLYTEGREDVLADRYTEGNEKFRRAYQVWPRDPWFLRYARAFIDRRQYQLAVEKYDQLVYGMSENRRAFLMEQARQGNLDNLYEIGNRRRSVFEMLNYHRRGILEHASLQSEVLANYERADDLLRIILHEDETDYQALINRGDNYMRWAEVMETPEGRDDRYEQARESYARLITAYGTTDEILFRMLRYFIRTDNKTEVDRLTATFQGDPDAEINPQIYAELAGYLIEKDETGQVRDIIFRALDENDRLPELHYQLARFYRDLATPGEELTALENARRLFEARSPLTTERLGMFIDTDIRLGEYYYQREEYITAEQHLVAAEGRYERALEQRLVQPEAKYGRLYAQRGDIYYFVERDFDSALDYYLEAEANRYESRPLDYRVGNIHYRSERFDQAVERFLDASGRVTRDKTLLWATGNALYNRENYFAAQAHYEELLEQLQAERNRIENLLVEENPGHRALIEQMIRANNNLGVSLYQLFQRDATNQELLSEGMAYLTRAQEIAGNYARDPETGERSLATNLAYINTREILYPENPGTVQIYNQIPDSLESLTF
jgi:tetratricopeptide (TPR) repeat protein